jgi:hypothetical protein
MVEKKGQTDNHKTTTQKTKDCIKRTPQQIGDER